MPLSGRALPTLFTPGIGTKRAEKGSWALWEEEGAAPSEPALPPLRPLHPRRAPNLVHFRLLLLLFLLIFLFLLLSLVFLHLLLLTHSYTCPCSCSCSSNPHRQPNPTQPSGTPEGEGAAPLEPALPPLQPLHPRGMPAGWDGGGEIWLRSLSSIQSTVSIVCLPLYLSMLSSSSPSYSVSLLFGVLGCALALDPAPAPAPAPTSCSTHPSGIPEGEGAAPLEPALPPLQPLHPRGMPVGWGKGELLASQKQRQ